MDAKNKLYFGDNLKILRDYVEDASVDLIHLDPPFNSSATYNVLFKKDVAQGPLSGPVTFSGGAGVGAPPQRGGPLEKPHDWKTSLALHAIALTPHPLSRWERGEVRIGGRVNGMVETVPFRRMQLVGAHLHGAPAGGPGKPSPPQQVPTGGRALSVAAY